MKTLARVMAGVRGSGLRVVGSAGPFSNPGRPFRHKLVGAFACVAFVAVCAGCSTMRYVHGVPNLVQVEAGLYRSGEPKADGWIYLRDVLHVRERIALDYPSERQAPPPAGIVVVEHAMPPSDADDVIGEAFGRDAPTVAEVLAAVDAIDACMAHRAAGEACAAGCLHGQDRTGLIFAVYRVRHGWTREAAWAEALRLGFHRELRGLAEVWERMPGAGLMEPRP